MNGYIAELPQKIIVEKGALDRLPEIAAGLGKDFLVVADKFTKDIGAGKIASDIGCRLIVIEDSTIEQVKKLESEKAGCIISFGGGKVIDVGKLAAHNKKIPFISCPTACSHDGIASRNASITVDNQSASFIATVPFAVVADLGLIRRSPYRLTASGAADVLSNYCAVADWKLGVEKNREEYSEPIARLSLLAADLVTSNSLKIKNLEEDGLKNLVWSLIYSGMSMSLHGSSRPASGAEHMFSHALDRLGKFGLHGEQVGIGTIFFSYLQGQDWVKIKNTLENLGAPTKIKQLEIPEEVFVGAMLKAKDVRKRYTILDGKPLTEKLILQIAEQAGIF